MSKIINLYGGPGTGKSTSAAWLFSHLKQRGTNAELVREYVKDWAWEGRKVSTYDQLYLLGKQVRRESILFGKVDVIITDAPVLLGVHYARAYSPVEVSEGVRAATLAYYRQSEKDGNEHVHVLLKRSKPYDPSGRYQTEEEARAIDAQLRSLLMELGFKHTIAGTDPGDLQMLMEHLGL